VATLINPAQVLVDAGASCLPIPTFLDGNVVALDLLDPEDPSKFSSVFLSGGKQLRGIYDRSFDHNRISAHMPVSFTTDGQPVPSRIDGWTRLLIPQSIGMGSGFSDADVDEPRNYLSSYLGKFILLLRALARLISSST